MQDWRAFVRNRENTEQTIDLLLAQAVARSSYKRGKVSIHTRVDVSNPSLWPEFVRLRINFWIGMHEMIVHPNGYLRKIQFLPLLRTCHPRVDLHPAE